MIQQEYCVCTSTGHVIKSSPRLSGVGRLLFFLFTLKKFKVFHKSRKYFRMQAKECMYRIRIKESFEGTTRDIWFHLPAQARSSQNT